MIGIICREQTPKKKGLMALFCDQEIPEAWRKNVCTGIQRGRTGEPKYSQVQQSNAEQGKFTEYSILDFINKELVRG